MEITNGKTTVELPERLAKLLLSDKDRDWKKGRGRKTTGRTTPTAAVVEEPVEEEPIPMTHIPGVVSEVSMREIRHMVDNRMVDVYLEGRVKKVKPSEVRAAHATWKGDN